MRKYERITLKGAPSLGNKLYQRLYDLEDMIESGELVSKVAIAKEFAEKLKARINKCDYVNGYAECGLCEEIDELLKEYLK